MNPSILEIIATSLFAIAVLHTFSVTYFQKAAQRFPEGSIGENLFHFLGEVEVVFGLWAAVLIAAFIVMDGFQPAVNYLDNTNFTEAAFVFVIMCMAGTRPMILLAEKAISLIARLLPLPKKMAFYVSALVVGPLLGSFITEPAAMTVTALILVDYFYSGKMSTRFKYATLGLLFVNISIGGTLTHFAAPPVLMVAGKYGWGLTFMIGHFGLKALVAILIATSLTAFVFRSELTGVLKIREKHDNVRAPTWWIYLVHLCFLALVVLTAHHMSFFFGLFLFFLGFTAVTQEYQDTLKLRESLLVGFFLGGLVVLGGMQQWWLREVLAQLGDLTLFTGATMLTAVTDNAALTYLGSLVELSDSAKYMLVAGAVTGGGLTVIANAPNPAGYGILKSRFENNSISPLGLCLGALVPTLIAALCFLLLPSF